MTGLPVHPTPGAPREVLHGAVAERGAWLRAVAGCHSMSLPIRPQRTLPVLPHVLVPLRRRANHSRAPQTRGTDSSCLFLSIHPPSVCVCVCVCVCALFLSRRPPSLSLSVCVRRMCSLSNVFCVKRPAQICKFSFCPYAPACVCVCVCVCVVCVSVCVCVQRSAMSRSVSTDRFFSFYFLSILYTPPHLYVEVKRRLCSL
jgi:hypothetical protein